MDSSLLYSINRYSSKPTRGFQKKYSPELNQERKNEFWDEIFEWNERQIRIAMGFINALTYSAAEKAGAIEITVAGKKSIVPKRIQRLCRYGSWKLYTTLTGITKYINEWWDGAVKEGDRTSVRRIRNALSGMGMFKFKKLKYQERSWQTFFDIDFGGLLLLYEVLEESLIDDHFCNFEDDLPEHKGAMVRAFYNTCEEMLGTFRRSGEVEESNKKPEPFDPKKPFVPVFKVDGMQFDSSFRNAQGVSLKDVIFTEKAELERKRAANPQFAKKQWFDSASYRPQFEPPY
jgi:hypothetical protein